MVVAVRDVVNMCTYLCSGNILETKDAESFVAEVKEFVKDNEETELSFPSSLTSYQRRIIHEVTKQCVHSYNYLKDTINCVN